MYVHMYCSNLLDISLVEKESVVGSHRGRCERRHLRNNSASNEVAYVKTTFVVDRSFSKVLVIKAASSFSDS